MLNHGQSAFPAQLCSALPGITSSSSGAPSIGAGTRPPRSPAPGAQLPAPCLSSTSHFQVLFLCPISKFHLYVPTPRPISCLPTSCTAVTPAAALTTSCGGSASDTRRAHQHHSAGLCYDGGGHHPDLRVWEVRLKGTEPPGVIEASHGDVPGGGGQEQPGDGSSRGDGWRWVSVLPWQWMLS